MDESSIDRGIEVVAALAPAEPSVADVVDVLEAVVDGPDAIRTVLDRAVSEGMIERDGAQIQLGRHVAPTDQRARVIRRDGEHECRRCGRTVNTGHFVRVGESEEIGPYGSTCVRRITGRE